jgi:hypothetical protein
LEKKWLVGARQKMQILFVNFPMHAKKIEDEMEGLKDGGDR